MMDCELTGCGNWEYGDTLTTWQREYIQSLLYMVVCPDHRQWIENNLRVIDVFEEPRGYWGSYNHETQVTQLWARSFEGPEVALMETLVHESSHAINPLLGEAYARLMETQCVTNP
jgi:hypothetical protein